MDAITDGGLETTLIHHAGLDLPHFAAFVLLRGRRRRAGADWGARLGDTRDALAELNRRAVELVRELRAVLPSLRGAAGCCGTDGRHAAAIAAALTA